jgi:DNA-directed RNA polymerase subunit RPC12/RpoP
MESVNVKRCIRCGEPVSEEEIDKRYKDLLKRGIQPMMVIMCNDCRLIKLATHKLNYND